MGFVLKGNKTPRFQDSQGTPKSQLLESSMRRNSYIFYLEAFKTVV